MIPGSARVFGAHGHGNATDVALMCDDRYCVSMSFVWWCGFAG